MPPSAAAALFLTLPPRKSTRRTISLVGFLPFKTAEDALENAMAVAEGSLAASLQAFLQANLPAKAKKVAMAVSVRGFGPGAPGALHRVCTHGHSSGEPELGWQSGAHCAPPRVRTARRCSHSLAPAPAAFA